MKRLLLLPLGLSLLAAGLPAQKQVIKAIKGGFVYAKANQGDKKSYTAGILTRTLVRTATDRKFFPPAFATSTLVATAKKVVKFRPGSELATSVKCAGAASGGAQAPAFLWTYYPAKKVQGVIHVFFTGNLFGTGKIDAYVNYGGKEKKLPVSKQGPFRIAFDIPVKLTEKVSLTYGIREAGLKSASAMGRGSLECKLSFYFEAKPGLPKLVWKNPDQKPNCAKGTLGHKGDPVFGKPLQITLTGATDTGKVRVPYAILLVGNSNKRFHFLRLPLDLTLFGAKGCLLYTNIVGTRVTRIDKNGDASVSVMIPGGGPWTRWFRALYFQYAYSTTNNRMGLVFTNYGAVVKE